jgi:phage terminase small subunit
MPRKSAAALAVVPMGRFERPRIETPSHLKGAERELFTEIVALCEPEHFVASDWYLVRSFCQATLLAARAFEQIEDDPNQSAVWERAVKTQAALAAKLRLAPSGRVDPLTLARRYAGRTRVPYGGASYETIRAVNAGQRRWGPRDA